MPAEELTPPFKLADRYDVTAELGRGGFAIVFRATDCEVEREVAVKVLRDELLTSASEQRFSREMLVTARLKHPNIVQLYDSGTWHGRMYYVMEYIRGRTLEAQLRSEGQLPIDEAISITKGIAGALAFAHEAGVVHRDIKPANILLGPTNAMLSDFGIARVLEDSSQGPITSTGVAVGTVQYMSPEQLCAERVDARSDQYSLALVFYEMLAGVGPHVTASLEGLRSLRTSGSFAPVKDHRPATPLNISDAISRALSPAPADRFRDMREFLAALDVASAPKHSERELRRRRGSLVAGLTIAVAGLASVPYVRSRLSNPIDALSSAQPSVLLVSESDARDSSFAAAVGNALEDWRDANRLAWANVAGGESLQALRELATRTRATIAARASIRSIDDSTRWTLTIYDRRFPSGLTRLSHQTAASAQLDAGTIRAFVARMLVGPAADSAPGIDLLGTPTLGAATAYAKGWTLMRRGLLDSSRTAFSAAALLAPKFANAHLWAAQVGEWLFPRNPSLWQDPARQADALGTLRGTDSLLATGLVALASGDFGTACTRYRLAVDRSPDSFAGWFGLGQCQRLDSVVVRDVRTPLGVRFRSSHWSALDAYQRALARMPSNEMSDLFDPVVGITYASGNTLRGGVGLPPDTAHYYAFPSLSGDSVVNVPINRDELISTNATPDSFSRALERARRRLLDFTRAWISSAPTSSSAWFNHAYALELNGSLDAPDDLSSATHALERADRLNLNPEQRARIDVARVRVAARRGAFDQAATLARAAVDRKETPSSRIAAVRAPLAAYLGDIDGTTNLLRLAAATTDEGERHSLSWWGAPGLPTWLGDSLRAFGVRASLGRCDGLRERKEALERDLSQHVAAADLPERREALLHDAYWAAVPCLGTSVMRGFKLGNPLEDAVAALDGGRLTDARNILGRLYRSRRGISLTTVSEDALLAESWIWTQLGDSAQSRTLLEANMKGIARMSPFTFDEIMQAAALSRIRQAVYGSSSPRSR